MKKIAMLSVAMLMLVSVFTLISCGSNGTHTHNYGEEWIL